MPGGFSQERAAGAGRTLDAVFPGNDTLGQNGAAYPLAQTARGRPGVGQIYAGYSQSQSVTGTGAVRYATGTGWNGRGAIQLFPGAAGTAKLATGFSVNPALGAAAVNSYVSDPMSCYRLLAIMSFGAGNSVAGALETSWVWSAPAAGNTTLRGGASGFGFIQTAVGTVSFARRAGSGGGGGLLTETPALVSDAAGILNWHAYEIRIIGATSTTNAQLKAFIDGTQVNLAGVNGATLDWVADGLPNALDSSGGLYGFNNWVHGNGAAAPATGLVFHRIYLQAAPDEINLL
jgi:hypothetical protein